MSSRRRFTIALAATVIALAAIAVEKAAAAPRWWRAQARCIHLHESVDWHRVTDWLGRPSWDHGGYQIDVRTWATFAPRGFPRDPAAATPGQQTAVAYAIWRHDGDWHEWPNSSRECGLR